MHYTIENFINYCDGMNIAMETEDYNTKLNRKDILKQLNQFARKYPKKDWYVSFKAALVLYGIETESNDIDLYGTPEFCDYLIRKGFHHVPAPYGGHRITITDRIEIFDDVNFQYTKLNMVDGINVATLDDIEAFYQKMNRPKDQETLRKIREYRKSESLLNEIIAFNQKLNGMEYIICTDDGKVITEVSSDDFANHYRLLSPSEFEKRNGGICWDYVVYEAWYFKKNFPKVKFKTFFNVFDDGKTCPTHDSIKIVRHGNRIRSCKI